VMGLLDCILSNACPTLHIIEQQLEQSMLVGGFCLTTYCKRVVCVFL
jgi:hypothetical protein